jgi:hypothetical protein
MTHKPISSTEMICYSGPKISYFRFKNATFKTIRVTAISSWAGH